MERKLVANLLAMDDRRSADESSVTIELSNRRNRKMSALPEDSAYNRRLSYLPTSSTGAVGEMLESEGEPSGLPPPLPLAASAGVQRQQTRSALQSMPCNHFTKLELRDMSYSKNRVEMLRRLRANMRQGEVVALMGDSKSGKTTLLELLAGQRGRARSGKMSGEMLLNEQPFDPMDRPDLVGYVPFRKRVVERLTVREALMFAALLHTRTDVTLDSDFQKAYYEYRAEIDVKPVRVQWCDEHFTNAFQDLEIRRSRATHMYKGIVRKGMFLHGIELNHQGTSSTTALDDMDLAI